MECKCPKPEETLNGKCDKCKKPMRTVPKSLLSITPVKPRLELRGKQTPE